MTRTQPGQLDRRITVQSATQTRTDSGGFTESWATLATLPAQFMPNTSREFYAAGLRHSAANAGFRIRYRSDITGKNRILYNGQLWDIVGEPIEEGRREWLLIAATYAEGVTP